MKDFLWEKICFITLLELKGSEDSGTLCIHDSTTAESWETTNKLLCVRTKKPGAVVATPKNGTLPWVAVKTIPAKFESAELNRTDELTIEGPALKPGFIRATFAIFGVFLSIPSALGLPLAPENWVTAGNSDLWVSSSVFLRSSWNSISAVLAFGSFFVLFS